MKKLIPLVLLALVSSLTSASNVHAASRIYFDVCKTASDSDCLESVAFQTPTQNYGSMSPAQTVVGSPIPSFVHIFVLPGYNGPDGSSKVRLEARIDDGQVLFTEAGGFNARIPTPRPKVCDTDPKASQVCEVVGNLDPQLRITVTLRIKDLKPGVSQGTMSDMSVAITKESYGTKLVVSALPMRYMGYIRYDNMANGDTLFNNPAGDYIASRWHFALSDQSHSPFGSCNSAGAAFVQANAEYSNSPTWNSAIKALDMQTSSSHFEPDGVTPFKGLYSARISADLVKCAWGIDASKAAGVAQIQILSNSTDSSVASISSNYRDGWLNLDARNYEYSSPIIRVKMSGAVVAGTQSKKSTITCIKGKMIKKLTSVNPKCAKGYVEK